MYVLDTRFGKEKIRKTSRQDQNIASRKLVGAARAEDFGCCEKHRLVTRVGRRRRSTDGILLVEEHGAPRRVIRWRSKPEWC